MVIGMDWLESCGPMLVDWTKKTLKFQQDGCDVQLQGLCPDIQQMAQISAAQLDDLEMTNSIVHVVLLYTAEQQNDQPPIPARLQQVLDRFQAVFDEPSELPKQKPWDHAIPLMAGTKPVNIRPYRYTPEQKDEIEAQVKEMLKKGLITPSASPFASPVLLVKKKDLTWRFCVDFRHLNAITIKARYPMPVIDELLDELAGSRWFSKLDLRAGYHQIRLRPEDEYKTAFKTHQGQFQFRVLPYGVTSGPPTFQGVINIVLSPLLRHGVLVFMDDILIHSATLDEHEILLTQVLQLLKENELFAKRSKCTFAQQKIHYLGHVISQQGVATDDSKVEAVRDWPVPDSVKKLRGFLGLAGYYRKFVRNFGVLSKPLTDLLRKGVVFVWTPTANEAFCALKQALIVAPVLALPDFAKQFIVETDASATGISAVLMQEFHPIAYLSKALAPKNLGLSAYEKECLALLLAIEHWRPYLQHAEFVIRTDQKSLLHLTDQRLNTPIQQRAFTKLIGLQYSIQYNAGQLNRAADALSRRDHPDEVSAMALSVCKPVWLEAISSSYHEDLSAKTLMTQLAVDPTSEPDYQLQGGILRFKGRVWVGSHEETQLQIIRALHASAAGGHSGFHATYNRVKRLFAWKGSKQQLKTFVQQCLVCQRAKTERSSPAGLLQPLPIPQRPWAVISLDFIEGLPKSGGYNAILVVVDKFSKYAHFIPLTHPFTALDVAKVFMQEIFKLHGLPLGIISDTASSPAKCGRNCSNCVAQR